MLLRPAQPEDALAVAGVHVRSWQAAYRNILPDDYLNQLRPEDRAAKYDFATRDPLKPQTIVAVEEKRMSPAIRGFATVMPVTDSEMPGLWRAMRALCGPSTLGQRDWRGAAFCRSRADAGARISQRNSVGADGERACGAVLSDHGWAADGIRRKATVWDIEVDEIRYARPLEAPSSSSQIVASREALGPSLAAAKIRSRILSCGLPGFFQNVKKSP